MYILMKCATHLLFCAVILLTFSLEARSQQASLTHLDANPCCVVQDGHGNDFIVSSSSSPERIYVTKVDSSGTVISELAFLVGVTASPAAAAVDTEGNLWIVGSTRYGYDQGTPVQGLIAKFDNAGTSLLFAATFGGLDSGDGSSSRETVINAIAFDGSGNPYLGGSTNQADFPVTPDAFINEFGTPQGADNVFFNGPVTYGFITKLVSANGTIPPSYTLAYSTLLGGREDVPALCSGTCYRASPKSAVSALAVDADGVVTAGGLTRAADFPVTEGAYQLQGERQPSTGTLFVTRLNTEGSGLVGSTVLGASSPDAARRQTELGGLALDASGNVVIDGITAVPDFPVTLGVVQPEYAYPSEYAATTNGFVTKLDSTGSVLMFSTYYGGARVGHMSSPRLDAQGNVWISASVFDQTGLVLHPDSLVFGGSLIAELAPDGSSVLFSELLPTGVAGQDLSLNLDGSLTAVGPATEIAFSETVDNRGFVLRLPRGAPSGVSILGLADSAIDVMSNTVAPGEYVSIFGTGLGPATGVVAEADPIDGVPDSLGGTTVSFDGIPAPIIYASESQINVLVPYELTGESGSQITTMQIASDSGTSQALALNVVPVQPHIFIVLNDDGSVNSPSNRARQGSVVTLLASGAGALQPALPNGTIATSPAPAPVAETEVRFSYSFFIPFQTIHREETVTPTYAGGVPGKEINLLQVDVQVPTVQAEDFFSVSLRVGSEYSPGFAVYAEED